MSEHTVGEDVGAALASRAAPPSSLATTRAGAARRHARFRPFLIEVAGSMEDPAMRAITETLRRLQNRYQPILRVFSTMAASSVSEAVLFGDAGGDPGVGSSTPAADPWFRRPTWAVSANGVTPIVPRLHPCTPSGVAEADAAARVSEFMHYRFLAHAITHNHLTAPATPGFTHEDVEVLVVCHYIHDASRTASFLIADTEARRAVVIDPSTNSLDAYERDLAILGVALTHVVVTHGFLDVTLCLDVLQARHPAALLVSGIAAAREDEGEGAPARVRHEGETQEVRLSDRVVLVAVTVPCFSPESQLVELRLCGTLVALFTGTAWGTDAAPRADVFDAFGTGTNAVAWCGHRPNTPPPGFLLGCPAAEAAEAAPSSSPSRSARPAGDDPVFYASTEAMRIAQRNLRRYLYDRYLFPAEDADESGAHAAQQAAEGPRPPTGAQSRWDRVVMFPSHGGYSNVSGQLDLYWAAHLGDLKRMRHARVVIDTLTSPDAYMRYARALPTLPRPRLFQANRNANLAAMAAWGRPRTAACAGGGGSGELPLYPAFIVDTRDASEYHRLHPRGAVNVPFSFPGEAYGAKRAELWLQCLLLPRQPIVALVGRAQDKAGAVRRLRAVSATAPSIAAFTLSELIPGLVEGGRGGHENNASPADLSAVVASAMVSATPTGRVVGGAAYVWISPPAVTAREAVSMESLVLLACSTGGGRGGTDASAASAVDVPVVWVAPAPGDGSLVRIDTPEKLRELDPRSCPGTVVLDVRTPYEFKNGSHQHSVHLELAALCAMTEEAAAAAAATSSEEPRASDALAVALMRRVEESAIAAGLREPTKGLRGATTIAVYCAGGYRSLIAVSLLQRARELAVDPRAAEAAEASDGPPTGESQRSLAARLAEVRMTDVAGGAFTIMSHRPDLWRVKDRSIICIS